MGLGHQSYVLSGTIHKQCQHFFLSFRHPLSYVGIFFSTIRRQFGPVFDPSPSQLLTSFMDASTTASNTLVVVQKLAATSMYSEVRDLLHT